MHTELSPNPQWTPEDLEKCKETNISFYSTKWPASYFPFQKLLSPVQTDATLLTNNSLHCWMSRVFSVCTPCCKLLDVVACCCAKFEAGQTFQPTTPNISFVPWSPKRSATMLDPFAQLFQHCWGHTPSLRMVYKDLRVVSFPRYTAGPNIVGSCCIRLHTTTNTYATTPNIVGAIALGKRVEAFDAKISGIVWVDKHYLWLVNSCLEDHRPIIISTCPPKQSLKSLFPTLVPVLLKGSEVENSTR